MALATVLALIAALLHTTWNLLIKTAGNREVAAWGQFVFGGIALAPVLLFIGPPGVDALPYLGISAIVHIVYVFALVKAYQHGLFSLVYPLARGGGALTAAVLGLALLGDSLPAGGWIALGVVTIGIASLMQPGAPRVEIAFALLTASMIGVYTVIDTAGSRHSTSGFSYGITLVLFTGLVLTVVMISRDKGREMRISARLDWRRHLVSGICLALAYSLVLVAVRFAPIGYVATLRESSIVIGAAIGWLFLHERLGRQRLISSVVIALGLVALVVWQ